MMMMMMMKQIFTVLCETQHAYACSYTNVMLA